MSNFEPLLAQLQVRLAAAKANGVAAWRYFSNADATCALDPCPYVTSIPHVLSCHRPGEPVVSTAREGNVRERI